MCCKEEELRRARRLFHFCCSCSALKQWLLNSSKYFKYWGWPVGVSFALWSSWWRFPYLKKLPLKGGSGKKHSHWEIRGQPHGLAFRFFFTALSTLRAVTDSDSYRSCHLSFSSFSVSLILGRWQLSEGFQQSSFVLQKKQPPSTAR